MEESAEDVKEWGKGRGWGRERKEGEGVLEEDEEVGLEGGGEVAAEEGVEGEIEEREGKPPCPAAGDAGLEVVDEGLPVLWGELLRQRRPRRRVPAGGLLLHWGSGTLVTLTVDLGGRRVRHGFRDDRLGRERK